jgi:hypothetical protein
MARLSDARSFCKHLVQTLRVSEQRFMISWTAVFRMLNSSTARRTETCRSRITIRSTASLFSSMMMVDGRPSGFAPSKPHCQSLNSAIHLVMTRYYRTESIYTSSNSFLITIAFKPFRMKNLISAHCSKFDVTQKKKKH